MTLQADQNEPVIQTMVFGEDAANALKSIMMPLVLAVAIIVGLAALAFPIMMEFALFQAFHAWFGSGASMLMALLLTVTVGGMFYFLFRWHQKSVSAQ